MEGDNMKHIVYPKNGLEQSLYIDDENLKQYI